MRGNMTDDILAPYRKTPPAPASRVAAPQPPGKGDYVAFSAKKQVPCLRIRRVNYLTYAIGYNILLINTYDDDKGETILLFFSVMRVRIKGRNLQELVYALNNKSADYVMEFDPDRWVMPTDPNAPFIESIEVKITEGGSFPEESEPQAK
jgi:hypothetical protein